MLFLGVSIGLWKALLDIFSHNGVHLIVFVSIADVLIFMYALQILEEIKNIIFWYVNQSYIEH